MASIRKRVLPELPTVRHSVEVSDGDTVVLHDDIPPAWAAGDRSLLLVHGLTGCHAAPYMLRLAARFYGQGMRVFRMDMRGCGAGVGLASQLTHAGRSDDIASALGAVASLTTGGPIGAVGISLSANQILRSFGRIGASIDDHPSWFARMKKIAAVAPPLDLVQCSENMNRISRRPYNHFFIRSLLKRVPPMVKQREDFQRALAGPRPKTLWQLDDRFTAPLSGFRDAAEYYRDSSAINVTMHNPIPTLVLAAEDDPLIPVACFVDEPKIWPISTHLIVKKTGGHVGFIDRKGSSWMDEVLVEWFSSL